MINQSQVHDLCETLGYISKKNKSSRVCERHSGDQCKAVTDIQGLGVC